jgi:hypothetical protein
MKRMLIGAVFLIGPIVIAASNKDVFFPSQAAIADTCTVAYKSPKSVEITKNTAFFVGDWGTTDSASIQTPLGSIKSICSSDAKSLKKMLIPKTLTTLIIARGKVTELSDARSWATVITLEKNGTEVARVFPDSSISGETSTWKVDCTGGCSWSGTNYYFFELNTPEILQALNGGAEIKVIVQKYGDIQTYSIPETIE